MILFWIWCVAILAALVLYFRQVYSRFKRYGVKHFTPLPFIGNTGRILFRIGHFADDIHRTYNAFPGERFVGRYEMNSPMIVIRDLDLIKKIAIKDFEHFLNHRLAIDKESDALFGRNLLSLKDQEWKDMRSTLSPAFTSSKIRVMVPFMLEVGDEMIKALNRKIKVSEGGYADVDVKDMTTRYASDVIASCVFGLKVNSHSDENNEFFVKGREASNFKFKQLLMFFGFIACPKLMKMLKISLFTEDTKHFFRSIVLSTMQDREEHHIIRPDMIHLLMEAKKGKLSHGDKTVVDDDAGFATVEESAVGKKEVNRVWSDDDLIAQIVVFFLAGFEPVSVTMSFLLHELALNPEVQDKLAQEIKENDAKTGGKFDYYSIQQMTYLDMVISETLRLWPPAIAMDRICTKNYNLGRPNDSATEDYIIQKGDGVMIPVWAFHHSPNYYPDPYKFDPERFSSENKSNIKPFSYMPFGLGPRNCIGSRFALCEVKVMAYQLLQSMEVSPAAKTQIPAHLSTDTFNLRIKGGHWIRFKPRT